MTQSQTNGQKAELFRIQCSFGDNIMQVSTLGSGGVMGGGVEGGERERGYSLSMRPWIFSQFNFMKAEKERGIFNL